MSKQRYAANTEVSASRSKAEIEDLILRYGGSEFGYMTKIDRAVVHFEFNARRVRFTVGMPNPTDDEYLFHPVNAYGKVRERTQDAAHKVWEQACRSRWRALLLVIKAKLEAVEVGITTFEEEFLAHIICDDGRTIGEALIPHMDKGLAPGKLDRLALPEARR